MAESAEFDRGHMAGGIEARLAGHDRHFEAINGSLAKMADEMHLMTLGVQRLGDQAEAAAKTVVTTAAALKDAEEARRNATEQSWSPIQKALAVLGSLIAAAGLIWAITSAVGKG
jgi:hypothetical protein